MDNQDLSVAPENEDVEKRIRSLLNQLQNELVILDKVVYKGKNQHRRALYFQYLLKVRRDVKLLQSANLKQILNFLFEVINKDKSTSRSKRIKLNSEKHHYQMRLLGVARLLSQMVEPIVKAAIELSSLLARTFFMGFSLMLMALLGRLRVLVQQILLDVVSVFNRVSSSSQGTQSTVLNFGGVKVVREYHPSDNDVVALECVWETDAFVLLEKTSKSDTTNQVKLVGTKTPLKSSNIKYQVMEAFLGEDEQKDASHTKEDVSGPGNDRIHATDASVNQIDNEMEASCDDDINNGDEDKDVLAVDISADDSLNTSSFPIQKFHTESKRNVAFVSVGGSTLSRMKERASSNKETVNCPGKAVNDKEDSFFSLLASMDTKDSLF